MWKYDQLAITNSLDYHAYSSCLHKTHSLALAKDTLQTYYQQIQQIKKYVAKRYPVIGNVNSQCIIKMIHNLHKLFTLEKKVYACESLLLEL